MKKKAISILLATTMVMTTMVGCGSSSADSSSSDADAAAEEATEETADAAEESTASADTLVYWSMWEATEPQGIAIQEAIDAYTEETGVKVDVQFKGRTGQREGLQAALDAGTRIDMFDEDIDRVNGSWGDYLMDLEEFAKAADYEATANAGLISACREVGGGTLKSIPYQPNVFAFFYNKDLFEEAGIEAVPTTWDEFLDVCQKLKDAGITPITCDDAYADCMIGYHLGRLAGEAKVKEIVADGKWDDPIVMQMAEDYQELAEKGYFSENIGSNVWPAGQNSELALGEVAMYLNGSWLPNEVADMAGEDFNWGCFSYPAVTEGATDTATGVEAANYGAQVYGINKDSALGQEAFDLICKITKGEYVQKLADESNGIPADTTNTEWPALVECAKPVMDACTTRYSWAVGIESNDDMTPVIKENFIKLMAGTLDAQGFVDAMTAASK